MIQRSPNQTRGRTPWALSSSLRVSVACSNSGIRVSRHSSRPSRYGELAPTASCTPAITWLAFQYAANSSGEVWTCSWVLVHAASGTIESVVLSSCSHPGDRDPDVLPARVEDLLAEQVVARVRAERLRRHVGLGQRGQDADHHQVGAHRRGLALRVVEAVAQPGLEGLQPSRAQPGGLAVDLHVELAELGLEGRVGDGREGLHAPQRRVTLGVDQVELDLEPGHRVVGVEPRLAQHPGEDVEPSSHLLPVARPVRPRELLRLHLFSHGHTIATCARRAASSHRTDPPRRREVPRPRRLRRHRGLARAQWAAKGQGWAGPTRRERSPARGARRPGP